MTEEQKLMEKLRLIEALYSGAATPGERDAAASARERIRARLRASQEIDPPIEYSFKLRDRWSHQLLTALLRRYGIKPYRYRGQRYTTIMARVPVRFVNETLWPEFVELNRTLSGFLSEVTNRVIATGIEADTSEPEERAEPAALGGGSTSQNLAGSESGFE
jgi:hypothetical protein